MLRFHLFEIHAFVEPLLQTCGEQFPRSCSKCGHLFRDFGEFVKDTVPIGTPICFDEDEPSLLDPIGTLSMVNCRCGTTLALACPSHGEMYDQFVAALRTDAKRSSITVGEVLELMRKEIRDRASRG